jgi:hypothetical protein
MRVRRVGFVAVALALATAPGAFGADPPKGSHGQETDAHAATTPATYARAVAQVCAHALLFEQPHSIGTRAGALAVADDIRASTQRRLALVAGIATPPGQRTAVVRWLAVKRSLAEAYALNYIRIYDLIAAPRTPRHDTQAARRLASLMHSPDRFRRAAAGFERQLRVPDCTGGYRLCATSVDLPPGALVTSRVELEAARLRAPVADTGGAGTRSTA